MAKSYDVAILGSTPAGLAAALRLCADGRRVAVVEFPSPAAESPLADWAPADLFTLAPFLKPLARLSQAKSFRSVQFLNADASRRVEYRQPKTAGYLLPAGCLAEAMRARARKAGVSFTASDSWPVVELGEDRVMLIGHKAIEARLMLVAQEQPAHVADRLSLPASNMPVAPLSVTAVDIGWSAERIQEHFAPALHLIDLEQRGQFGLFFPAGKTLHVRLISDSREGARQPGELSGLLRTLRKAGLLPPDMPLTHLRGGMWQPPAGLGLEIETQLAKRTLLIGTAGGFVEPVTGQTLTPTIRSALAGAQAAHKALDAAQPQTVLAEFKALSRKAVGNYLRPLNASIQLLLPLLFTNEQMVTRFAHAMLFGESL